MSDSNPQDQRTAWHIEGLERHRDELDAAKSAAAWLDRLFQAQLRIPSERVTSENDAGLHVYWRYSKPFAAFLTFRDDANFTYGVKLQFSASAPTLLQQRDDLAAALRAYVVLGAGRCTIGRSCLQQALAVLRATQTHGET
jgi:hypothetical protein